MSADIKLELTAKEAEVLWYAAEAGTRDDAIDCIGLSAPEKAAYRRASEKLKRAMLAHKNSWKD